MDSCSFCGCGFQYPLEVIEIDNKEMKICADCNEKDVLTEWENQYDVTIL